MRNRRIRSLPARIRSAAVERAIDWSYVGSFRMIMLLSAGLALMGAASAALTINSARPADDPDVPA